MVDRDGSSVRGHARICQKALKRSRIAADLVSSSVCKECLRWLFLETWGLSL